MIEPHIVARLVDVVGERHVRRDLGSRRAGSTDHSWMSPILRRDLAGMLADVIVRPGTAHELARIADVAFCHDVPVTGRGRGTGNYGQAVPLAGGIVIDASRLTDVVDVVDGWITAGAGATFVALEAAAHRAGQELAMFPSTTRSTLGGFLCGGAGGIGSIEHGFIWDGFAQAAEVVDCVEGSTPTWVQGHAGVMPYLHAFGTTGLLTAATVRLAPRRRWTALFASFTAWEPALASAWTLISRTPVPRSLAVDEPALVRLLPHHRAMPVNRVSMRAIVEIGDVSNVRRVIGANGGRTEVVRPESVDELVSLSYNHITLRAVRARRSLCHLQVGGPMLASHAEAVRACLPGSMLHVDCHRYRGEPWFGGVLLSEFRDDATLAAGSAELRSLGVTVVDPHTFRLGVHADLPSLWRLAARTDPKRLLNPGKLPPAPLDATAMARGS